MARPRTRIASARHETRAWVTARVTTGDADLILTLFTESLGRVSAIAKHALRSRRRFAGALEPLHTLHVTLQERDGVELMTLTEARLDVVRHRIASDLGLMQAAGRALAWLKRAAPARVAEPELWARTVALFDRLENGSTGAETAVAAWGVGLLESVGFGLELEACVSCGAVCPEGKPARVDPARGGLVCRACGGGSETLSAVLREALIRARDGDLDCIPADSASRVIELTERTLALHVG